MNLTLSDRMRKYENIERRYLTPCNAVILRLDGCHFHTYTKCFKKPYDSLFLNAMRVTAKLLCENIQGAKLAYTQSDEISILLIDFDKINSQRWFNGNIQKMVSVSASMASIYFYKALENEVYAFNYQTPEEYEYIEKLKDHLADATAVFDSRCFILPKEEVVNYFRWRQIDCTRNSIQSAAQTYFSPSEIHNKTCDQLQEMLFTEKNINWSKYPSYFKNGSCIIKKEIEREVKNPKTGEIVNIIRPTWVEDKEIPIFTQNRDYIRTLVYPEWDSNHVDG